MDRIYLCGIGKNGSVRNAISRASRKVADLYHWRQRTNLASGWQGAFLLGRKSRTHGSPSLHSRGAVPGKRGATAVQGRHAAGSHVIPYLRCDSRRPAPHREHIAIRRRTAPDPGDELDVTLPQEMNLEFVVSLGAPHNALFDVWAGNLGLGLRQSIGENNCCWISRPLCALGTVVSARVLHQAAERRREISPALQRWESSKLEEKVRFQRTTDKPLILSRLPPQHRLSRRRGLIQPRHPRRMRRRQHHL